MAGIANDGRMETCYNLQQALGRGVGFTFGQWTFPSTYAADGITCTLPFTNKIFVGLEKSNGNLASGLIPAYSKTDNTILMYQFTSTATTNWAEMASDTAITGVAVQFIALGYD